MVLHIDTNLVGIIGAGRMGIQLTQYFAENEFDVLLKTSTESKKEGIIGKISKNLEKRKIDNPESILSRITIVTDFGGFKECGIILETSKEDMEVKKQIFRQLSEIASEDQLMFTNTSSLSVGKLSEYYAYPEKMAGFHFFNPVAKMNLVEVIRSASTADKTIEDAQAIAVKIGKTPIVVNDSPGFVVNRLLLPQINDAVRLYEQGLAKVEDIDTAVKLGLNHPMGPLALADLIGIDVCVAILNEIYEYTQDEHFKPVKTLTDMLGENRLGFKTGCGFYTYEKKV